MKIGIDVDGTMDEAPWLYSLLTRALREAGHEVHVITYRDDREKVIEQLREWGISYDGLHLPDGIVYAPEWKGELAGKLGLDVMFEDSPEVLSKMPSGVLRMWCCQPEIFDMGKVLSGLKR